MTDACANTSLLIEKRSIDYLPQAQGHARLLSPFTLWLGARLQISVIVTGALAVLLGGDAFCSSFALLVGQLLGGAMVLHAAQGSRLGLSHRLSSRVQFGGMAQ